MNAVANLPIYYVTQCSTPNDLDVLVNTDMNGVGEAIVFIDADCTASDSITTGAGIWWDHSPGAVATINAGTVTTIYSPDKLRSTQGGQIFAVSATKDVVFTRSGVVSPNIFGIDGNADEIEINYAIESLPITTGSDPWGPLQFGGTVKLEGKFTIAAPVKVYEGIILAGDGKFSTEIYNGAGADANAVECVNSGRSGTEYFATVRDMRISGNASSGHGLYVFGSHHGLFENLQIDNHGKSGIYVLGLTVGGIFNNIWSFRNDEWGLVNGVNGQAVQCTTQVYNGCKFRVNDSGGAWIQESVALTMNACHYESNYGVGLKVEGWNNVFNEPYFENNDGGSHNITDADAVNPCKLYFAAGHDYQNGQSIVIHSVEGMTNLNGNTYTVANETGTTLELSGINAIGWPAHSGSAGYATTFDIEVTADLTTCYGNVIRDSWQETGAIHLNGGDYTQIISASLSGSNPNIVIEATSTTNQIIDTRRKNPIYLEDGGAATKQMDSLNMESATFTADNSVVIGASSTLVTREIQVATGGTYNILLAAASGDDFTVDTDRIVVEGDVDQAGTGVVDPGARWDVGGFTATYVDGTDDLGVKDDLEVDGDAYIEGYVMVQNVQDLMSTGPFYSFDGDDGYIDFGDPAALDNMAEMSIITNYKLLDTSGTLRIASKEDVWYLYYDGTNVTFGIHGGETLTKAHGTQVNQTAGVTYIDGGVVNLYLDGVLVDTEATGTSLATSAFPFSIAGRDSGGAGYIEDTRLQMNMFYLFNMSLSATEVKEFSSGSPIPWKYVGASETEQTSGTLTIGKAYRINNWITNDDFTNIGGTNVDGTEFVATGTTPTTWTNNSTVVPIGALVQLEPESIYPNVWYDTSGNGYDGAVTGTGAVAVKGQDIFGHVYGNEIAFILNGGSAAQNTWYEIVDASMVSGPLNGCTHDGNGAITVTEPGFYEVSATVSFEDSVSGDHSQWTVSISNTETGGFVHFESFGAAKHGTAALIGIYECADNDTIEVSGRTTDAGTPDITVDHLMIKVRKLGGT